MKKPYTRRYSFIHDPGFDWKSWEKERELKLMAKDNTPKIPKAIPYTYSYGYNEAFINMMKENLLTEDALKRVLDARGVVEETRGKFSWLRLVGFSTVMYLSWKITSDLYELFMKKDDEKPQTVIEAEEKKENE